MKLTPGEGGIDQHAILINLEKQLGKTTVATAAALRANINTYKHWKSNRRSMSGTTLLAIELLCRITNTKLGKSFSV